MRPAGKTPLWMPLSILLFTWGVYGNSLGNSFHYDDTHSIVENRQIRKLGNIPGFFADPRSFSREPAMAMYRPLLLTTYALNYAVDRYRPWGYHLVNMLLHGLAALVVYRLLRELGTGGFAWWGGMAFGLHPIHSQAVNYISSRSELLAGLGVLVAFYLAGVRRERRGWALAAYAAGLLSKEAAVVLVPLLVLREWVAGPKRRIWRAQWPFWGMTLLYLAVITGNRFLTRSLSQEVRPYGEQLLTQLKALVFYLQLTAVPVHLSVEHSFAVSRSPLEGVVLSSGLLLGSLIFLAWRGKGWGGWGIGWFLAGLGLTFLVPLNVLVNEHRLYLPVVGLLVALGGYLGTLRKQLAHATRYPRGESAVRMGKLFTHGSLETCRFSGRRLAGVGWGLLLVLGLLTWQRNRVWRDDYTLWKDAADRAPEMFRAQSNWGLARYGRGDWEGALAVLQRALELNPRYAKTWNNLGLVYEELGRSPEAIAAYERALERQPDLVGTRVNLGRLKGRMGNGPEAEEHLRQALKLDPLAVDAWVNLGLVYQRQGKLDAALQACQKALEIDPQSAEAYNNLGLIYQEIGEDEEAGQALEKAVALAPDYEEARINLQVFRLRLAGRSRREIYAQLVEDFPQRGELWKGLGEELDRGRDGGGAAIAYETALRWNPRLVEIYPRLGAAYRRLGRLEEAIGAYTRGLVVDPENLALYRNLASAQAAAGRLPEAMETCLRILEIDPGNERARDDLEKLKQVAQSGSEPGLTEE